MSEQNMFLKRKYLDAKSKIKKQIINGVFSNKLPGERILADQLGYSYLTVRQAVNELVDEGLLYRLPRKGTYVSNRNSDLAPGSILGFYLHESYRHGISSPYYSLVFKHLQKVSTRNKLNMLYFTRVSEIDPKKVNGVIAAVFPENEKEVVELATHLPLVLIDNDIKGSNIPAVIVDNFNATYRAIEYAYQIGHRSIGYVTGAEISSVALKRLAGYKTALQDHGLKINNKIIFHGDYEFETGYKAADYFASLKIGNRPTFIHCANDLMAMGLIKGFSEKGIKVPDDISVSGFDDIDDCERYVPSITTMSVDLEKMALSVIDLFVNMSGSDDSSDNRIIIPADLLVRDSTREYSEKK